MFWCKQKYKPQSAGASIAGNGELFQIFFQRLSNSGAVCASWSSGILEKQNVSFLGALSCMGTVCAAGLFVILAVASAEYRIVCLIHLHKLELCGHPAATLLQAACTCICISQLNTSRQAEDDHP
eukprot:1160907-Pelagomonas_calceolata.AAC.2